MSKIVVDTNIVFSGILNTNGLIGDLLMNSHPLLEFYSASYLRLEIDKHLHRLMDISGLDEEQVEQSKHQITKNIIFISEEQIPFKIWHTSVSYVRDVDMDDIAFVALSEFMDVKLWTGDKKLRKGLEAKGFTSCISTQELLELREDLEKGIK
jgi:predicted nucleic acid-binding protein